MSEGWSDTNRSLVKSKRFKFSPGGRPRRTLAAFGIAALLISSASAVAIADSRGDLLKRAGRETRKGNYEGAEAVYRSLLAADDRDAEVRLRLSYALLKLRRLQEAYDEASRIAVADSANGRARTLMGIAVLRAGQIQSASTHLAAALDKDPRDALAIAALAEIDLFENRARPAYNALKRAIDLDPSEPDFYRPLARACAQLELYLESADALEHFLQVAPDTEARVRANIKGLIQFYRCVGDRKLNVVGGDSVATVNFDLIRNRPYLNVIINGKGPLRFVLDTGASMSVISDEAARKLGVKPISVGGEARAVGGTGFFPVIYSLLNSVAIGGARLDRVPVYIRTVYQPTDSTTDQQYDGYFGLSFLSNYLVTLDYKLRTLTLDRRDARDDGLSALTGDAAVLVAMRTTRDGLASTEARLPAMTQPLNFIIDTGASATVVSKALVKSQNLESLIIPSEKVQVTGAAGTDFDVAALRLGAITVDSLRKRDTRALIMNLDAINQDTGFEQHGILGGDFLRHFQVQIDLRRFQLTLIPQTQQIQVVKDQSH